GHLNPSCNLLDVHSQMLMGLVCRGRVYEKRSCLSRKTILKENIPKRRHVIVEAWCHGLRNLLTWLTPVCKNVMTSAGWRRVSALSVRCGADVAAIVSSGGLT
ncbi:MAG TPA: hypothetical protein VLX12_04795, partial [Syntrophorhabdales bacterium]|nr:hypothetical protein [Syntrophorhabdales bacterium]